MFWESALLSQQLLQSEEPYLHLLKVNHDTALGSTGDIGHLIRLQCHLNRLVRGEERDLQMEAWTRRRREVRTLCRNERRCFRSRESFFLHE
jgi:hypothetical protein